MMKKLLAFVLTIAMALSLAACGDSSDSAPDSSDTSADAGSTGDKITLSVAFTPADETPEGAWAEEFKRLCEEKSGGQLEIQIYPAGQMGTDREILESTQFGSISIGYTGLTQWTNFVADLNYLDGPFVCSTREQVYALFEDEGFNSILTERMESANYHYLGAFLLGFRELTCNKEINSLSDFNGMKIRVIESQTPLALWSALGCNPTPLAFAEVYTALQQGTVDAQENPVTNIYDKKFYEQQKYLVLTNHQVHPDFVAMNLDLYNSLSDDLKAIVDESAQAALSAANQFAEENEELQLQEMNDYGCQVVTPSDSLLTDMYNATQSVRDDLAETYPEFAAAVNAVIQ